jgi:hypothetical protein
LPDRSSEFLPRIIIKTGTSPRARVGAIQSATLPFQDGSKLDTGRQSGMGFSGAAIVGEQRQVYPRVHGPVVSAAAFRRLSRLAQDEIKIRLISAASTASGFKGFLIFGYLFLKLIGCGLLGALGRCQALAIFFEGDCPDGLLPVSLGQLCGKGGLLHRVDVGSAGIGRGFGPFCSNPASGQVSNHWNAGEKRYPRGAGYPS